MTKKNSHMWTKDELKTLLALWESKTVDEIAEELDLTTSQVVSMARRIRQSGYALPKKTHKGYLEGMVKEVLTELKLIK